MQEFWAALIEWLTDNAAPLGAAASCATIAATGIASVRWLSTRSGTARSGTQQTLTGGGGTQIGTNTGTVNQGINPEILEFFEARKREDLAAQRADLERAHGAEQDVLRQQIAELQRELADPQAALEKALARNLSLEAELKSLGGKVPADRIARAIDALSRFDYDQADALFAEVEAANSDSVADTARAAFGRGEVAEAQIRWRDAATHYTRAARLAPGFEHLSRAQEFTARIGDYTAARRLSEELLDLVRAEGAPQQIASALNAHALRTNEVGEPARAEALYREALDIDRATIGEAHPDYATHLNNLALVLLRQEHPAEAVPLFEQALQILQDRLPPEHPTIATVQRNLDTTRAMAARAVSCD